MINRSVARVPAGAWSVLAYLAALSVIALDSRVHGPALASSPDGVAAGRVLLDVIEQILD